MRLVEYIIPLIAAIASAYFFFCDKSNCSKKAVEGLYYCACVTAFFSIFTFLLFFALGTAIQQ